MDQQLVQRTRYLLQTRFRRIRTAPLGNFELVSKQVLHWLEHHPILGSAIEYLDNLPGDHHREIDLLLNCDINGSRYYILIRREDEKQEDEPDFRGYTPKTQEEHASACLQVLRASIQKPNTKFYCLLAVYMTQEDYDVVAARGAKGQRDAFEVIQEIVVRDLYEYLDETLSEINAVNGLLQKYKQYAEWFQRDCLRELASDHEGRVERTLARHLQQYIFDQGIEFSIEPTSASGEIDLVLRDSSGLYILIDAKYIKPGANHTNILKKIADGFNQVARYCNDYNQPIGFLATFVGDDVAILLDLDQNDGFKYLRVGGSSIYYIEINIADRPTASKAGKAKQVSISRSELIEHIGDVSSQE